jgi:hypothetical protein
MIVKKFDYYILKVYRDKVDSMNANAEINGNALSVALSEINASIFEMGDSIPNGVYLEMMNNSKKVFDEVEILEESNKKMKEKIENRGGMTIGEKVNYIIGFEDKMSKLDYIIVGTDGNGEKYVHFYNRDNEIICERRIGDYIRVFESGCNYKFMRIEKINKSSIVYSVFKKLVFGRFFKNENISLKVTGTLRGRNILIYESSKLLTEVLFNTFDRIEDNGDEGEMVEDKFLKIDMQ